ncbi:hypothetical protein IMY05_008G0018400 [Salix suchowensis]|nr:hypothetical protein IMY05_008G0018400 [Salix suchowensis]
MDRCFLTFKHHEPNQTKLLLLRFQLQYAIFWQFESSRHGYGLRRADELS